MNYWILGPLVTTFVAVAMGWPIELAFRQLTPHIRQLTASTTELYMNDHICDIKGEIIGENELERLKTELIEACDVFSEKVVSGDAVINYPKRTGLLGASSSTSEKLQLDVGADEIIQKIAYISKFNPNPDATRGWGQPADPGSQAPPLEGVWKLRFTTAADATFKPGKRGAAVTTQIANATSGFFLNQIAFPDNPGKVEGFTVFVKGTPMSDHRMALTFARVEVDRKSRAPRLFGKLTFWLPNLLPIVNFFKRKDEHLSPPFFDVMYLDEDLRIHKTDQGNYFVQTRLYQVWDPAHPRGWTTISTT